MNRGRYFSNDTAFTNDQRLAYLPEETRSYWKETVEADKQNHLPEDWQNFRKRYEIEKRIIKILAEAKVPLMAGTDFDNPFVFPGFSLHDELALYVESGMKPIDALRTATLNPVIYLNMTDSLGHIQKGKRADFVLLNGNPLTNMANTKNIFAVLCNGRLFTADDLHRIKTEALRKSHATKANSH